MILQINLRYSVFPFILLVFSLLLPLQTLAQEQVTHFEGEECCYDVKNVVNVDDQQYAIARDFTGGVQIFKIDGASTSLVFSNHSVDKFTLIDQGFYNETYYLLYSDRLEIFHLASQLKDEYSFSTPLEISGWDRYHPSIMTDYGLLLIPANGQSPMQFFNFSSETWQNIQMRYSDMSNQMFAIDSMVIYFETNRNENETIVHSQNVLSNTHHQLFTVKGVQPYIQKLYNTISVIGDQSVYMTRGLSSTTDHLFDFLYESYNITAIEDFGNITFFDQTSWSEIRKRSYDRDGNLLSDTTSTKHIQSLFEFHPLGDNRYITKGLDNLYSLDFNKDSLELIDESQAHFWTDSVFTFYFHNDSLNSYNHKTKQKTQITALEEIFHPRFFLRDSAFNYYATFDKLESTSALYQIDANSSELNEVLHVGEYQQGLPYLNTSIFSEGNVLLLGSFAKIPSHIFDNGEFHEINSFNPTSAFIHYKGRYYLMGREGVLYEWLGEDRFKTVISDIGYKGAGILVEKHGQLFFYKVYPFRAEDQIFHLQPEENQYTELKPTPDFDSLNLDLIFADHPDYFILHSVEQEQVWAYNVRNGDWVQLISDDYLGEGKFSPVNIIQDKFIWLRSDKNGNAFLMRSELKTGEISTFHTFSNEYDINYAGDLGQCGQYAFFYFRDVQSDTNSFWATDGTSTGTSLLDTIITDKIIDYIHYFRDTLYFNNAGKNNRVFAIDCNTSNFHEAEWGPRTIVKNQYEVGNRTIALGLNEWNYDSIFVAERKGQDINKIGSSPIIKYELNYSKLNDTLLVISGVFDSTGENIWHVNAAGDFHRPMQFGRRDVPHNFKDFVLFDDDLYFLAYQYGPGRQVWRIPFDTSTTSTVDMRSSLPALHISPNPSTSQITINNLSKDRASVTIYDTKGTVVKQFIKSKGVTQFTIDISVLSEGAYFISSQHLNSPENIRSGAFIKQ